MSKEITKEEIDKIKPEIVNEQAVLLLNLSKVMNDTILYPPTRLGYDYFSCLLDDEPAFIHNHLFGNNFTALLNLKPYQLAVFTPKLKFYKRMLASDEYIEMIFDDHLSRENHMKRYDPNEILSGKASDGSGVGILGFEWRLSGDITDTPEKRLQTYTADLRLRIEKMPDLFATRADFKKREYQISNLFAPERGSGRAPDQVDENAYELLVEVGWNILDGNEQNEIYKSIPDETLEAIRKTTVLLELGLHDHNLEFNQDGSLGLTLNYVASLTTRAGNPLRSNLVKGKYRDQIEAMVVSDAIKEASDISEDEKDDTKRSQRKAAIEYYEILGELRSNYRDIMMYENTSGMVSLGQAIPGWAKKKKGDTNFPLFIKRVRQIYAKFAAEHQAEIDKRVAEFQDYKNARFVIDYLLDSGRVKVFQVKKENVLLTDKQITTTRTVKDESAGGSVMMGTKRPEQLGSTTKTVTETKDSDEGIDTISEKYEEAGFKTVVSETNKLSEVVLFEEDIHIYDEYGGMSSAETQTSADGSVDPTEYPTRTSRLTVKKVYPSGGGKAPYYWVNFSGDPSPVEIAADTDDADVRVARIIASRTKGTNQSTESTIDPSQGVVDIALAESDSVFRGGFDVAKRMQELKDIDEGVTDDAEQVDSFGSTSKPWQKGDEWEQKDQFVKAMMNRIVEGREVQKGGSPFLNIKYVTVGDIFDAVLHRAYDIDEKFRDKFILGPIVINEAEALLGSADGFSIRYPESDTKKIEVVITGTGEDKKREFREKIYSERQDRIYSLADLPISLDALQLWLQKNISENRAKIMTFDKFLSGLLKTLLSDAYNMKSEARHLLPKANFSFELDTFPMLQKRAAASSRAATGISDIFGMSINEPYRKRSEDRKYLNSRIDVGPNLASAIKEASAKDVSTKTAEQKNKLVDYHLITAKCKLPDKRLYDYAQDMKDGIPHFFIGQDSGIVKSIEFSQTDIPGQVEKNVLNAQNAIREGTSPAGVYLKRPYNATVNLVGNPFFSRGQMVFINPSLIGAGSLKSKDSAASQLGLGGYYRITEISNRIDASGRYETQLECVWQSYGTGQRSETNKTTEPKSQARAKAYDIKRDVAMEMLGDHLYRVKNGNNKGDPSVYLGDKVRSDS